MAATTKKAPNTPLDVFKARCKNGEFKGLDGALKAIGKSKQLSATAADKEKARAWARSYFNAR